MQPLIRPSRWTSRQTSILLWHRYPEGDDIGYGERHVVHGHTPNPQGPERLSRRTNLDTLAWKTGRLVIAVFDDHTPVRRPNTSNCPVHARLRCKRHA